MTKKHGSANRRCFLKTKRIVRSTRETFLSSRKKIKTRISNKKQKKKHFNARTRTRNNLHFRWKAAAAGAAFSSSSNEKDRFDRWIKSSENADLEGEKAAAVRKGLRWRGAEKKREEERSSRRTFVPFQFLKRERERERENYAELQWVLSSRLSTSHAQSLFVLFASCTRVYLGRYAESTADTSFSLYLSGTLFRGTIAVVAGGSVCIVVCRVSRSSLPLVSARARAHGHRYATPQHSLIP